MFYGEFFKRGVILMRATALTDVAGNSLVGEVSLIDLKAGGLPAGKHRRQDVWSVKLNERKVCTLGSLHNHPYFDLLANKLSRQGVPLNTVVVCGRKIGGKLRMIRCEGTEYREYLNKIYTRKIKR